MTDFDNPFGAGSVSSRTHWPSGSPLVLEWDHAVEVAAALVFYSRAVSMLTEPDEREDALASLAMDEGERAAWCIETALPTEIVVAALPLLDPDEGPAQPG